MSLAETFSSLFVTLESGQRELGLRWGTIGEIIGSDLCVFFPGDGDFILVDQQIVSAAGCERGDVVLVARIESGSWCLVGKLGAGAEGIRTKLKHLPPPEDQRYTSGGVTYDEIHDTRTHMLETLRAYDPEQMEEVVTMYGSSTSFVIRTYVFIGEFWWYLNTQTIALSSLFSPDE